MSTVTACSVDRAAWRQEHVWSVARQAALARAGWQCESHGCEITDWDDTLEVHHVEPVEREHGYRNGCQHHQENLRVLCRLHHAMEHRCLRAQPLTQLALFRAA